MLGRELAAKNKQAVCDLGAFAKNLGFGVERFPAACRPSPSPRQTREPRAIRGARRVHEARACRRRGEALPRGGRFSEAHPRDDRRGQCGERRRDAEAAEEFIDEAAGDPLRGAVRWTSRKWSAISRHVSARELVHDWRDFPGRTEPTARRAAGDDEDQEHSNPEIAKRTEPISGERVRTSTSLDAARSRGRRAQAELSAPVRHLERRARFGALLTDFMSIRAGRFPDASGGYLLVRAHRPISRSLSADPGQRFKRVLRATGSWPPKIPSARSALYATTLRPQPSPLDVRVVLIGARDIGPRSSYSRLDPDFFNTLFQGEGRDRLVG